MIGNKLKVTIRDRYKTIFEGDAMSLSSKNSTGDFDILPSHANFITLIFRFLVIDKGQKSEVSIDMEGGGVLTVLSNKVTVYLGI